MQTRTYNREQLRHKPNLQLIQLVKEGVFYVPIVLYSVESLNLKRDVGHAVHTWRSVFVTTAREYIAII